MDKEKKDKYDKAFEECCENSVDCFENSVVSSTEMTGLLQTPPENKIEASSYMDLASIPKPKKNKLK